MKVVSSVNTLMTKGRWPDVGATWPAMKLRATSAVEKFTNSRH